MRSEEKDRGRESPEESARMRERRRKIAEERAQNREVRKMSEKEERNLEQEIRKAAESEPVPEALEPERIRERLEEIKKKKRFGKWKQYGLKKYVPAFAAAACICLVAGIGAAGGLPGFMSGMGNGLESGTGSGMDNGAGSMESAVSAGAAGEDESAAEESAAEESGSRTEDSAKNGGAASLPQENRIVYARNYNEIYEYLQRSPSWNSAGGGLYSGATQSGAVPESGNVTNSGSQIPSDQTSSNLGAPGGTDSSSYTDTNIRQEGVEEGDIVKTDGKNLYIMNNMTVEILGIESGILEEKAEIVLDEDAYVAELYVRDDRLLVVYTKSIYEEQTDFFGGYRNNTYSVVYDVSDPSSPQPVGNISQSGSYHTMRVSGDYVYVLTDYSVDSSVYRGNTRSYVPEVQGELMDAGSIIMPPENIGCQYTVITAFSLKDPGERTDSKAVFGNAGICYVSTDSIYVTEQYYSGGAGETSQTSIRRIAYEDGELEGIAQTKIEGILNDSFCIDEYEGSLRLVTTVTQIGTAEEGEDSGSSKEWPEEDSAATEAASDEWKQSNSLYILDEKLQEVSRIEDIAPDEQIYSARFMGDTGYFVTFRQVDPLFSVDLSDPEHPEIIGALKIPGFSEYLHPYGDGLLLGLGMATDDEGITTTGVKLSMFDISDPSDVKETDSLVLEDMYYTDAAYDYRAVYTDAENGLFGFVAYGDDQIYYIFTYEDGQGFQKVFERKMNGGGARGLRVGAIFYLVSANTVESYRMDGYAKIDDIVL